MVHILEQTQNELKKIQGYLNLDFQVSLYEKIISLFKGSFSKAIKKYAYIKKEILLNYSSLYSDIKKDKKDTNLDPSHIVDIEHSLLYITKTLKNCGELLEKIPTYDLEQQKIVGKEKRFFTELIKYFNDDLHSWMKTHRKEIIREVTDIEALQENTTIVHENSALELQKKRLEILAGNIEKIKK